MLTLFSLSFFVSLSLSLSLLFFLSFTLSPFLSPPSYPLLPLPLSVSLFSVVPTIMEISPNQTVFGGDNISLVCTATGNPPPVVQWVKDGLVSQSTGSSFPVTNTLDLKSVTVADAGTYICNASNKLGCAALQSTLVVQSEYAAMEGHRLRPIATYLSYGLTGLYVHVLSSIIVFN